MLAQIVSVDVSGRKLNLAPAQPLVKPATTPKKLKYVRQRVSRSPADRRRVNKSTTPDRRKGSRRRRK
jgi:hypothetical protein